MIKSVNLGKEIVVTAPNKIGILADMSRIMADHGINIEGVAGYEAGNEAKIMLVVDDTLRAVEALQKKGYTKSKENEVIVLDLENKPGALKNVTAMLAADKINIRYTYGTSCSEKCATARLILATSENEKALVLLKKK
jgi:hypothetical protein